MCDYYFTLGGLGLLLKTHWEITISENLRPFLTGPQQTPACTICVRRWPVLPKMRPGGVWHGTDYYDKNQVFYCHTQGAEAFAVLEILEDNNMVLSVLPEFVSYFSGSEGILNRIGLETLLLGQDGLLLHASLIEYAGKAVAFAGPSGVGKSTQAALWESMGAEIINGDRALLRMQQGKVMAYGSPYAGTSGIYKNISAPLQAVVLLQQAQENELTRLTPGQAFRQLFPEITLHRWDKAFVEKGTDLCLAMLERLPVYLLRCRRETAAAELTKRGLGL